MSHREMSQGQTHPQSPRLADTERSTTDVAYLVHHLHQRIISAQIISGRIIGEMYRVLSREALEHRLGGER